MSHDHIALRAARDRLIDFLAFGQTAPLADLHVPDEKLTVPYKTAAEISIEDSQQGVLYQLRYPDEGAEISASMQGEGIGDTLVLKSNEIAEDVTFTIRAVKLPIYLTHIHRDLTAELEQGQLPAELASLLARDRQLFLKRPADIVIEQVTDDEFSPQSYWRIQSTTAGINLRLYKSERDGEQTYTVKLENSRRVNLNQSATIKVGLNRFLKAWVFEEPFLDQATLRPKDARWPRLVSYGHQVTVKLANSQEGVRYKLVSREGENETDLSNEVTGNLQTIELLSNELTEDVDLLIRATKSFDELEDRPDETTLLETVLPVRVRANLDLLLQVEPSAIIPYDEVAQITIARSQHSAAYQLFIHQVADDEFRRVNPQKDPVVTVPVEGEPSVNIAVPPYSELWSAPAEFREATSLQQGNGALLKFTTDKLTHESLVIVRGRKEHAASPLTLLEETTGQFTMKVLQDADPLPSTVRLKAAVAILVQPNTVPGLRATGLLGEEAAVSQIQLFDGQAGVFYHLIKTSDETSTGRPAYFHQRDELDPQQNKGVGQIEIGVDFVPVHALLNSSAEVAQQYPAPPLLDLTGVALGETLTLLAQKAQTRVTIPLSKQIVLHPIPEITPESSVVDYNGTARILIEASVDGERYELWLDGQQVGNGRNGNGGQRGFTVGNITEDVVYELRVTRPQETQIPLTRIVHVPLLVRPNGQLAVSALQTTVQEGTATTIVIAETEVGVTYQLMTGGEPRGSGGPGNGAQVTLFTPPLTAETTFTVRASRTTRPEIFTDLAQQVTIQIEVVDL